MKPRLWVVFIRSVFAIATLAMTTTNHAEPVPLRVGVYNNPPKLMLNEQQELSGIMGDLLQQIASRENWRIEPVPCTWSACLLMLENGELDLLPDVAKTGSREQRYQFHSEPALMSWSQVYTADDVRLANLLELDGKTVAVLEGSVQEDYLQNLASNFSLDVNWLPTKNLDAAFDAVVGGKADAVVSSHYYGNNKMQALSLNTTPILFQPVRLFYAVSPQREGAILEVIDAYLTRWKLMPSSVYYQVLEKWTLPANKTIPLIIWWLVAALVIIVMLIAGFNQVLRRQVSLKTRDLFESENRLNTILNSLDAIVYIKDRQHRYRYINQKITALTGLKPEALLGETDEKIFNRETCQHLRHNDSKVLEYGERLVEEEEVSDLEAGGKRHFLSVKIPLRDARNKIYALCGISTDITNNKKMYERLQALEFSDPLTGLPNRFELFRRIDKVLKEDAAANGAVMMIDVDDFKIINESRGHGHGDELLTQIAQRLLSFDADNISVSRISSDEFACLVQIPAEKDAKRLTTTMATEMRQLLSVPYQLSNGHYNATVCIGIALFSDAGGQTERLVRLADLALNEAKHRGRNSQCFFYPQMQEAINRRSVLEVALRDAIENRLMSLYLQPQVNKNETIIGMEALLRWHDRAMGPISPTEFIPIAEDSGLIIPLGQWVIEMACEVLSQWRGDSEKADWTLAVNISPRQFRHSGFVEHVEQIIRQKDIDADRLKFEITENLLIDNLEQVAERMNSLQSLGIRFSLDDFGTGYASLSYLKLLPIHQLKIDQSFVRELTHNLDDEAIIKTILALGDSLELAVIAEGVETQEQAARLKQLGCNQFQGFLYGQPAPADDYFEQRHCG
ncbi:EAL domain-containing protein [Methylophaga sp.]|uniref:EAL domain-containing protein n=1 Tax=Methylophaga sp. TaxID=2024840 RepID=UPI0013FFB2DF|nr:EAL domain-containing protein [Methylophaga sp.]MTI62453.1 EAL domain-containing protein [Methylophaga sp.]